MHGNLLSAIWVTSHWTSFVKFGLKTARDISYDMSQVSTLKPPYTITHGNLLSAIWVLPIGEIWTQDSLRHLL